MSLFPFSIFDVGNVFLHALKWDRLWKVRGAFMGPKGNFRSRT